MATISLSTQLLVVSVITLQRQLAHNKVLQLESNSIKNNYNNKVWWNSSYDFIIVGAGSAGSVLAARLTEEIKGQRPFTVLLLEAGGPTHTLTEIIPAFYGEEDTWGFTSVPQKYGGNVVKNKRKIKFKFF